MALWAPEATKVIVDALKEALEHVEGVVEALEENDAHAPTAKDADKVDRVLEELAGAIEEIRDRL